MSYLTVDDIPLNLILEIGRGTFGSVYKVLNQKNEIIACKLEKKKSADGNDKKRLHGEYLLYKRFESKKLDCVPKVYKYYETSKENIMTMELLGKTLDDIFEESDHKVDLGTVMKLAITIIGHLENIHRTGVIHRDIKPNNFMFGTGENKNNLYIMDFGLSKLWYNNKKHIEYKEGRQMIGTPRYASINIHMGIEPSRRDDMESVGYMLIYLAKGTLPWKGLKKKTKENPHDKIGEMKMLVNLRDLCKNLPSCFYEYLNYSINLKFTEKPDYSYLKKLFIESAQEEKIDLKYYWE